MRTERVAFGFLISVLLAAGGAGWAIALKPELLARPQTLARLPYEIGGFRGADIPLDDTVEAMLSADFNVQRVYVRTTDDTVWLYLGYYGTERGGTPEHTPDVCYWANGWEVIEDNRVAILGHETRRAREFIVEQDGEKRLVLFWYRSYRNAAMPTTLRLAWDHFAGRLTEGRADGGLIRLSARIPDEGTIDSVRARLNRFAALLEPELAYIWPVEARPSGVNSGR